MTKYKIIDNPAPNARLKHFRTKVLKISQDAISKNLKYTRSKYGYIELGRFPIGAELIQMLKTKYNLNPEWLLEGQGSKILDKKSNTLTDISALKDQIDTQQTQITQMQNDIKFMKKLISELVAKVK